MVDAALKDVPKGAPLLARRAELLYLRGRWDDAEKAADAAVDASKPDELAHFVGRWVRAEIHRDRGDIAGADKEFRWFVRTYTERSNNDNDIKDPQELLLVGLAGSENARWHNLSKQFTFILQTLYVDAEKEAEKAKEPLWQAEYQAGALLLEKYNQPEALDSFDKALAINPRAAEALVGKGEAALQKLEIKQADGFADQALKINPRLPAALLLKSDVQLSGGDVAAALADAEKALAVNPRDEHALARKAVCFEVQRNQAAYDAVVKTAETNNPKPAVFYFDLGQRLEDQRRYGNAEICYKKAAELQPMLPGPAGTLGLLYMRLGREEEAAPLLDKGFEADKFNIRVANMRKVLKHLKGYDTLKTEHFVVRYDPKNDGVLAHFMADYLEKIYADLSEKFQYKIDGPILIEVFNSHEMFSGRVVALPDLHTVGATTGRMFAMASPNGKGINKPYNWGRVLRHEMVHVFNLEQTKFPHAALVDGRLGRQQRRLSPAAEMERAIARACAERRPDGPRQHRPRLHPAADAGRLDDGLCAESALCELHKVEIWRRFGGPLARSLQKRSGYGRRIDARLRRGQAGLREGLSCLSRRDGQDPRRQAGGENADVRATQGRPREEAGRPGHGGGIGGSATSTAARVRRLASSPKRCWTRKRTSRALCM